MPKKTKQARDKTYIIYNTKHLRLDLHDRMRVQAALRHTTIEDILNRSLMLGLPMMERETAAERQAQRQVSRLQGVELEEDQP